MRSRAPGGEWWNRAEVFGSLHGDQAMLLGRACKGLSWSGWDDGIALLFVISVLAQTCLYYTQLLFHRPNVGP
jgi:hypothetical protein